MLYYSLSILTGVLIAGMVAINGALTAQYGVYLSTVIIHIVGLVLISIVCLARREQPAKRRKLPLWFYFGGIIGVGTTVFNNIAFGRISLSAIVALGLMGQAVSSLCIDQFGWMGMPKRPFRPVKLTGLLCMLAGCVYMLWGSAFAPVPVIVSLLAGICVVTSRTVNARLCAQSSETVSTWFNYAVGLTFSLITLFLLGRAELSPLPAFSGSFWIYGGGAVGVLVVLLSNLTVARISAFYMTMLLFVGQVFTGIVIDIATTGVFSQANLIGGALVAIGMVLNLWLDMRKPAVGRP